MNDKPDFKSYSYNDLVYAKEHIDRDLYPDRYKEVCDLLETFDKPDQPKKKRRKFTKGQYLWGAITCYSIAIYQVWDEETIGRRGGFSMHDDPILFWAAVVVFIAAGTYNVVSYQNKLNSDKDA